MCFFSLLFPKAHGLDRPKHYLRLKFLNDNKVQFYVPKPEEELWDLVSCFIEQRARWPWYLQKI